MTGSTSCRSARPPACSPSRPVPLSQRASGRDFIDKLQAAGSTDINRALLEAVSGADAERPTVVIFLTDGLPTAGETDPDRIVANVAAAAPKSVRLFSFGVGYDVDTVLLDELSSGQRGTSAYVRPEQDIEEEVSGFYAKVSSPVLVDRASHLHGRQGRRPVPLSAARPVRGLAAGGCRPLPRRRDRGIAAGGSGGWSDQHRRRYTGLTFVERGGNEFIPRLWAQRKIGYLLTQIRLKGANAELVQEVTALATKFGIATPYTSFLVEEPVLSGGPVPAPGFGAPARAGRSVAVRRRRLRRQRRLRTPAGRARQPWRRRRAKPPCARQRAVAEAPSSAVVRQVGDKTFTLQNGTWVDTAFDAKKMKPEAIKFGSDRYFKLLTERPEIGRYLALGDKVTVVVQGKAYAIAP